LLEARSKLADLRNKLAGNDKLESLLSEVLANTQQLQALAGETGARGDAEDKQDE
jgi:type VI secretion system protein ImpB